MGTVRLFDDEMAIGTVEYTSNLDHWDGSNHTCGSVGRHMGIGKLKNGEFYVCHGTQWQGERDTANVITEDEAKSLALQHNPDIYEELFGEEAPNLTG